MNKYLSYFVRLWDPRPLLAKEWLEDAQKYEERLQANRSLNPQVVEFILQERNRIRQLFSELLPEFENRITVVVTKDAQVESCAVFVWKNYLYVLVSGALLGRPYDHPDDKGLKAWEWLARHEAAHIRHQHLGWFFHTRRLFRIPYIICCLLTPFILLFTSQQTVSSWLTACLWILGGFWLLQTSVGLALEWKADFVATSSIKDQATLKEVEKSLHRMGQQAIKRWPAPLGWIQYALSMLFLDPHPPLIARRWLLRRRLRYLDSQENQISSKG